MATLSETIANLVLKYRFDIDTAGIKKTENATEAMERRVRSAINGFQGLSVAVAALGAAVVHHGLKMDDTLVKMSTQLRLTQEQAHALRPEFRAMAEDWGLSAERIAEGYFLAISAGAELGQGMDIVRQSAKAAAGQFGKVEEIASLITSATLVFREKPERVMDYFEKAIEIGKIPHVREYGTAMARLFGPARALGVELAEINALAARLSRTGLPIAETVTQIGEWLVSIIKPSRQADDVLASLGYTIEDVKRIVADKGLAYAMQVFRSEWGATDRQLAQFLGRQTALKAVLLATGEYWEETSWIIDQTANSIGHSEEKSRIAADSIGVKLRGALQGVKNVLDEIFVFISPMLHWLTELPKELHTLAVAIAAVVTASMAFRFIGLWDTLIGMRDGAILLIEQLRRLYRWILVLQAAESASDALRYLRDSFFLARWAANAYAGALKVAKFATDAQYRSSVLATAWMKLEAVLLKIAAINRWIYNKSVAASAGLLTWLSKTLTVANAKQAANAVWTKLAAAAQWVWNTSVLFGRTVLTSYWAILAGAAGLFAAYATGAKLAAAAQWLLNTAVLAFPVVAVVAAIAGVVYAVYHFRDAILGALRSVLDWLRENWWAIFPVLTGPLYLLLKYADKLKTAFMAALNFVVDAFEWASKPIVDVVKYIADAFVFAAEKIAWAFKMMANILVDVFEWVFDKWDKTIGFMVRAAKSIGGFFSGLWRAVFGGGEAGPSAEYRVRAERPAGRARGGIGARPGIADYQQAARVFGEGPNTLAAPTATYVRSFARSSVQVGAVNVNVQGGDADSIATEIRGALQSELDGLKYATDGGVLR